MSTIIGGRHIQADDYSMSYPDCCKCKYTFSFDPMASLVQQRDLFYLATTGDDDVEDTFNIPSQWEFGYRLGFEYRPCTSWAFKVAYTHQDQEHTTRNFFAAGGPVALVRTSLIGSIQPNQNDVDLKTDYQMDYDLLDITASWSCCGCNGLEWVPYGGFRGLWFCSKANQEIRFPDFATGSGRAEYDAYGLVGGLELNYRLNSCLGFSGHIAGSIVSGDLESRIISDVNTSQRQTDVVVTHSVEGGVKLLYDWYFCGCCNQIGFGYEATRWSDQLPNAFFSDSTSSLFIHSLTAYFNVGF